VSLQSVSIGIDATLIALLVFNLIFSAWRGRDSHRFEARVDALERAIRPGGKVEHWCKDCGRLVTNFTQHCREKHP